MHLKRAKTLALVVIVPAIGFAGTTAWALTNSLPPGGNFDLTHWKVQLPTSNGVLTCDNGSVDEKTPADLEGGWTNAYFYTGTGGEMVFWAPVNGATTIGSPNPRSELRELIYPSSSVSNWFAWGTHILDATCQVWQVSTAPGSQKKVIIGQIHGYSGAALPTVKLQYNNGTLEGFIKTNAVDTDLEQKFVFVKNVGLSNNITYQIKVVNGLVSIVMNNVTNSLNIFVADPQWQNENMYFKAGSYNQDEYCTNPSTNLGARVAFSAVTLFHAPSITNQPVSQIVTVGSNVTFTVGAAGNPPIRYFWRLNGTNLTGKTNATLSIPNVQLTNAGNYSVIVTDSVGTVASVVTSSVATLTVLAANFTGTPTNGVEPLSVTFTNTSIGQAGLSRWDFGNGTLSTNALSFVRSYTAGTYSVSLIVTNAGVASTNTKPVYITVLPPPPTANFAATPTSGLVGLTVNFNDTSTGAPSSWSWNFGDTGTSTAQNPSHTYLAPGSFTVSLTASNSGGASTLVSNSLVLVITLQQSWSNSYGVAADSADADGDGVSNTNEFLTGFNPTNTAAFAHIISLVASSSDMVITYLGANGDTTYAGGPSSRTNVLEYSTGSAGGSYTNNFVDAGISQVLSNGAGSGVVTNMVDLGGATNVPSRYYRIRLVP